MLGEKTICLAVSEPQAGSDVAQLTTTARREGDHYVVNGLKKWITNGAFADYFVVAVRTCGASTPHTHTAATSRALADATRNTQ